MGNTNIPNNKNLNIPYGMTPKEHAIENLFVRLPADKRLDIERAIQNKLPNTMISITSILVKTMSNTQADIIQPLMPLLKEDCIRIAKQQ